MVFTWDSTKAATNLRKHKVDFHEAATVLKDVLSMTYPDIDHSKFEQRFVTIGISDRKRILVVAHADEPGSIRIISARKAHLTNEDFMKKANSKSKDDLRPEYDFANMKGGVRGKYAAQTRSRTNLVLLDPEIAKAFPTDASVNQVLRVVLDLTSRVPVKAPSRARSFKREKTSK